MTADRSVTFTPSEEDKTLVNEFRVATRVMSIWASPTYIPFRAMEEGMQKYDVYLPGQIDVLYVERNHNMEQRVQKMLSETDVGQVFKLIAGTGTGKTTKLPVTMATAKGGTGIVVMPTRALMHSVVSYVKGQVTKGVLPSCDIVIVQSSEDILVVNSPAVLFVAASDFLMLLADDHNFVKKTRAAFVYVDEVHERIPEYYLLRNMVTSHFFETTRVFLGTATMGSQDLEDRGGAGITLITEAISAVDMDVTKLASLPKHSKIHGTALLGKILMFLPGHEDFRDVGAYYRGFGIQVERIFPWSSTDDVLRVQQILTKTKFTIVVLLTQFHQTGYTFNADIVVDFGLAQDFVWEESAKQINVVQRTVYAFERIQRCGRVGRFKSGVAYYANREPPEFEYQFNSGSEIYAALWAKVLRLRFDTRPINMYTSVLGDIDITTARVLLSSRIHPLFLRHYVISGAKVYPKTRSIYSNFFNLQREVVSSGDVHQFAYMEEWEKRVYSSIDPSVTVTKYETPMLLPAAWTAIPYVLHRAKSVRATDFLAVKESQDGVAKDAFGDVAFAITPSLASLHLSDTSTLPPMSSSGASSVSSVSRGVYVKHSSPRQVNEFSSGSDVSVNDSVSVMGRKTRDVNRQKDRSSRYDPGKERNPGYVGNERVRSVAYNDVSPKMERSKSSQERVSQFRESHGSHNVTIPYEVGGMLAPDPRAGQHGQERVTFQSNDLPLRPVRDNQVYQLRDAMDSIPSMSSVGTSVSIPGVIDRVKLKKMHWDNVRDSRMIVPRDRNLFKRFLSVEPLNDADSLAIDLVSRSTELSAVLPARIGDYVISMVLYWNRTRVNVNQVNYGGRKFIEKINPLSSREKDRAALEKKSQEIYGFLETFYKVYGFKYAEYPVEILTTDFRSHAGRQFVAEKYRDQQKAAEFVMTIENTALKTVCDAICNALNVGEFQDGVFSLLLNTADMFIGPLHAYYDDQAGWFVFPRHVTGRVCIDSDRDLLYVAKYNTRSFRTRTYVCRAPLVGEDVMVVTKHTTEGTMCIGNYSVLRVGVENTYTAVLDPGMSGSILVAISDAAIVGMHIGAYTKDDVTVGVFSSFTRLSRLLL